MTIAADPPAPHAASFADASPVMAQYLTLKQAHPDCLLFFRLGDFYELFFEDAERAAGALDIALTRRGKYDGKDIPMCGVPVHASEGYLARLIRQGFRVAVCEQVEDPNDLPKRKGPLKRAVARLLTPGTLTEDGLLDPRRNNYLAALSEVGGAYALASVDMSTGDFAVEAQDRLGLAAALGRLDPAELLIPERVSTAPELFDLLADWKPRLTLQANARFDSSTARSRLEALHGVATLDGLGAFGRAEISAAGALVEYLDLTQQGKTPRLSRLARREASGTMQIDPATARNLELTRTLSGERRGSLLHCVDRTATGAGARLLGAWLAAPLTDPEAISARQDLVGLFVTSSELCTDLRAQLRGAADLERPLARLSLGRGAPRDLAAVRDGLKAASAIKARLIAEPLVDLPALASEAIADLGTDAGLIDKLERALSQDLPALARDGGFIAAGYAPDLDHQRSLRDESRRLIAALQARYAAETGVASLKIRHNNVIGYFIETPAAHVGKLGPDFIHRQTMAGAGRFSTVELGQLEQDLMRAGDRALAIELALFEGLVADILARAEDIARVARALALLDVAAGLADLAIDRDWRRPLVDDSPAFDIAAGRHPVVEAALAEGLGGFVPNDCKLADGQRLWLLTGPNMAGKSTFLRQNALIAILAQIGAWVPAKAAHLGVIDRLFSRVGAADDLARGRSTFMVEMVETAAILNQAGPRALVVLDEIGRGTATYDGLSLAWATVEHLHESNRCRGLFATHYHELTALAETLPNLACYSLRVKEWQGDVRFLHEVAPGSADRSYGIHVARLAGLPAPVLARAEAVLTQLEQGGPAAKRPASLAELPLFSAPAARSAPAAPPQPSAVETALAQVDPDALTPRAALELVYQLRGLLPSR